MKGWATGLLGIFALTTLLALATACIGETEYIVVTATPEPASGAVETQEKPDSFQSLRQEPTENATDIPDSTPTMAPRENPLEGKIKAVPYLDRIEFTKGPSYTQNPGVITGTITNVSENITFVVNAPLGVQCWSKRDGQVISDGGDTVKPEWGEIWDIFVPGDAYDFRVQLPFYDDADETVCAVTYRFFNPGLPEPTATPNLNEPRQDVVFERFPTEVEKIGRTGSNYGIKGTIGNPSRKNFSLYRVSCSLYTLDGEFVDSGSWSVSAMNVLLSADFIITMPKLTRADRGSDYSIDCTVDAR